jgi:DNA modification methylase
MIEKQKLDRYEMHKYWGKKPANDVKILIEKYSKEGDMILDPFSGYGVFCCEAFLLKRNVISNDLNPIANFINRQLLNKDINFKKIEIEWKSIKKELTPYINFWYEYDTGDEKVQLINILRDNSDKPLKARYKSLKYNKTKEITFSEEYSNSYIKFENGQKILDWFPTDELIENSRISAKKGMAIPDLFTKRALACHAKLLNLIEKHSTGNENSLLKLAFTANLANCSKLVPPIKSRGDMSQGAWMTGFYFGETYLENNVLEYFENRLDKTLKGKIDYLKFFNKGLFNDYNNTYQVTQFDAKNLKIPSDSIDYVFTDPPYGDAVPYFEQSIIWNSWLKFTPNYSDEIVISDSKTREKGIIGFENEIYEAFSEIRRVLKLGGYFSLTYHSLSGFEWRAITNACIKNGFKMVDFSWLVQKSFTPRQINRSKSIKGDVLITFRKTSSIRAIVKSDSETKSLYIERIKGWLIENPLETNAIFLNIMKMIFEENILIGDIDLLDVLNKHFTFNENQRWTLKQKVAANYV